MLPKLRSQKGKEKVPVAEPPIEPKTTDLLTTQDSDEEGTCLYRSDKYTSTGQTADSAPTMASCWALPRAFTLANKH